MNIVYNFDQSRYYLGSLCKRGHNWNNTNKSLRRIKHEWCVQCAKVSGQPKTVKTLEQRFWEKVDKREPNECWEWLACIDTKGYGQLTVGGGCKIASRLAWELTYGLINDKNIFVLHKCDNRKCCNPSHLFLGTAQENTTDMRIKGRCYNGKKQASALTKEDVLEIRELYTKGYSQSFLAKEFNIDGSNISRIITRKTWKHI